ncbi:hypothetical protein Mapa_009895 [Marchantia paleacea]|nr:hypothetical protein Mapa_009895 [Marchantia paleacea]
MNIDYRYLFLESQMEVLVFITKKANYRILRSSTPYQTRKILVRNMNLVESNKIFF